MTDSSVTTILGRSSDSPKDAMTTRSFTERPERFQTPNDSFQVSPRRRSIQSGLPSRMACLARAMVLTAWAGERPLLRSSPCEDETKTNRVSSAGWRMVQPAELYVWAWAAEGSPAATSSPRATPARSRFGVFAACLVWSVVIGSVPPGWHSTSGMVDSETAACHRYPPGFPESPG